MFKDVYNQEIYVVYQSSSKSDPINYRDILITFIFKDIIV